MVGEAGLCHTNDLLKKYHEIYGNDLGEIFYYLVNDHADLWLTYKQYRSLFGTNKERIDLLNNNGRIFFFNVERHFWNACILSLCRLIDPAKTRSGKNLTLYALLPYIENEDLKTDVKNAIDEAKDLSRFARERRNKSIAHSDYDIKLDTSKIETIATLKKMSDAIDATHKPLRLIAHRIANVDLRQAIISGLPNEESLLFSLYAAETGKKALRDLRQEKWKDSGPMADLPPNYPYPEWLYHTHEP